MNNKKEELEKNKKISAKLVENATRFAQDYNLAARGEDSWSDIQQVTINEDYFLGKTSSPEITFTFQNGDEINIFPATTDKINSWSEKEFDAYFAYMISEFVAEQDRSYRPDVCVSQEIELDDECKKAIIDADASQGAYHLRKISDVDLIYLEVIPKDERDISQDNDDQELTQE